MKPGDVIYIKATYVPQHHDGNMIRCITSDTGSVIWASPEEVKTADAIVVSSNIIRIDRGYNMA
jgi:hypothetical protein